MRPFLQNRRKSTNPRPLTCGFTLLVVICTSYPFEIRGVARKGDSVAEEMRAFSREIIAAYEKRNTATLKSFYARQPDALFFWERRMSYSWPQIESTIDSLVGALAELKLTTREFRSGGSGKNGWYAATFHAERVTSDGKRFFSDGRWTVIAEKVNGRWLIVHEHTSFPFVER
ncbi:MAG TPA: nuclear transport factor 2 family protein [Pyrinomonadaceae bacterium]|nr:nuclear transport factor 2 family protein [Pyrinomonadaceae bacterium]